MERYSKKLIVLIFTLFLLVLGLGTYVAIDKFVLTQDTCNCDCNSKTLLKDKNKTFIYDNPNYKNLKIPYINIDSIDAEKLNKEIESFYIDDMKLTDKSNLDDFILKYDYYSNSDVISIICNFHPAAVDFYKTANINLKTGIKVENANLFKIADIDSSKFYEIIEEVYNKNITPENLNIYKTTKTLDQDLSVYDLTIKGFKDKDVSDYGMYLNDNGELCVIVEEYQIAGSDTNRKIMNLNKKTYERIE